jgi:hypothetical protein
MKLDGTYTLKEKGGGWYQFSPVEDNANGTSLTDAELNRLAVTFDTQGWDATADGLANLAVRAADAIDSLHANIERLDAELRDAPTNPIQFARMQTERNAFLRAKEWLTRIPDVTE